MNTLKTIESEFDEEFPSPDGRDFIGMERISNIKSFIRHSLTQLVESLRMEEKVPEEIYDQYAKGFNDANRVNNQKIKDIII